MPSPQRAVLITGCSDGGMGAALAIAFHKAGLHVIATARNPHKMTGLASLGIQTRVLDVQSESSIADCVNDLSNVDNVDILINNAGSQFLMPVVDANIAEAKKLFDLNVWSHIATSIGANAVLPFQAVYNASKAALAMFSDSLRLELQPFGITVVDLRTGVIKTNLIKNLQKTKNPTLPKGSIYEPAREVVEKALRQEGFESQGMPAQQWADPVNALLTRISTVLPFGLFDGFIKKITGLAAVEQIVKK
ncbi:NAD(P)-binding protein [Xylariaceae sp. FL0662B]|nr:NAD(P)-binding protein [Xylariaceae sp. FL0662B]